MQGPQVSKLIVPVDGCFDVFELSFGFDPVFDFFVEVLLVFGESLFEEGVFFFGPFEFGFEQVKRLGELIFDKL